ncbi:hypothetical protein IW146_009445 [Coemansia sp. RSA 922]|nr:hypothetical protein H4S03_009213 [Coemansia sp. S3946]KAJ2035904.1 hypothetical protein H4S04_008880 [Coemansia sp. S16]KAJ2100956.1 hypothetical protein IW146_009445 [Coemansia sp. RSA 922]
MSRRNQRSRKRPRPQSPTTEPTPQQTVVATNSASSGPRPIPGFVWDAEKRRYFPATSRSANSSEQRDEHRETRRIQQVELIQQQPAPVDYTPALPLLLRQRSFSQRPVLSSDRLKFVHLNRSTPRVIDTNRQSTISALAIASDGQRAVIGHRDGSLWRTNLDNNAAVALLGGPGEIVSVRRIADRFISAHLGDEHSGGGLVAIAGSSRLRYADCSVFTASGPPLCSPPYTAVGLTGRVSVAAITNTHMREVFSAQTKTDILSTAFALDSPHVFVGGGRDGRVRLFDTRVASAQHDRKRGLFSAALMSNSSVHGVGAHGWRLVAASMDSGVRMWDVRMPDEQRSEVFAVNDCFGYLHRPSELLSATRLGFAVCQDLVAAAGSDNQIRVWSMSTGNKLQTVALPPSAAACTAIDLILSPAKLPTLIYSQSNSVACLQ